MVSDCPFVHLLFWGLVLSVFESVVDRVGFQWGN